MISRSLLRQCRTVASSAVKPLPTTPRIQTIPQSILKSSAQLSRPRFYSTETEAAKDATSDAAKQAAPPTAEDPSKKELEAAKKEVIDLKDKYLRQVAEFRNLQERTKREVQAAKEFALQRFAKDLIESIDNLDRALSTVPADKLASKDEQAKDLQNLYDGLKMTDSILMSTLAKHGLERFDPIDVPFNPNEHEATFMTPVKDKTDGHVFHTQSKGFKLNGRVLRAAKVGVVKNS